MYNATDPARNQANNSHNWQTEPAEPRPTPGRNPRLVVGGLDYFELIMEQEEQA